jgi:hypothetical protein
MNATLSGTSFKCFALSLLILGLVTSGINPLARARDPAATIRGPSVMTSAAHPMCDTGAIAACRTTSKSRPTGNFAEPGLASEPIVAPVQTGSGGPSSRLQVQLQLQRNLFTRGGRLAPVDVLVDAVAASAPTERTSKVPAWATQLRELTTRKRDVRGR